MAAALTIMRKKRGAGNVVTFIFQCILSGNYTNSGGVANIGTPGETLNFNAAANPNRIARPKLPGAPAGKIPAQTDIRTFLPSGYDGVVEQNAANPTAANYVLRIFTTAATELAAGAYPVGLTEQFLIEVDVPAKYI